MQKNVTVNNIKNQIKREQKELKQIQEVKNYIWNNLIATTAECDAVLDAVAQIIDKRETRIKELKELLINSL